MRSHNGQCAAGAGDSLAIESIGAILIPRRMSLIAVEEKDQRVFFQMRFLHARVE